MEHTEVESEMMAIRSWEEGEIGTCFSMDIKFKSCKLKLE
jgi:hypothetical protein